MPYTRIQGVGSYLPEQKLTNSDLQLMLDTSDEWIMQRVGIKERRIIGDSQDNTTTMSVAAGRKAIMASDIDPQTIDMVIVATATPQYYFPSTACLVQQKLKLRRNIPGFDINAACAGFIYAINITDQYIRHGIIKTVLLIGAESLSKLVDWRDRSTCVLFGDGAGALVVQAGEQPGILHTVLHADGEYADLINCPNYMWDPDSVSYLKMRGNETFKIAVEKLGQIVHEVMDGAGLNEKDIDWLVPHQANSRIINAVAKRLNLSPDQIILTIEKHGNTSAASIPLALDDGIGTGKIKRGDTLLLEAIGAGIAWGAALLKY